MNWNETKNIWHQENVVFEHLFSKWQISWKVPNEHGMLRRCVSRESFWLKTMFILFLPRPSQKTEPIWLFLFHFSNIHNMFRHLPWSHGIWFATDTKNITITRSNFHFLSAILRESESWAQSGLKTSTPQGWRPLPSLPSSKTSPWPPPSTPGTRARKALNPHCKAIVAA